MIYKGLMMASHVVVGGMCWWFIGKLLREELCHAVACHCWWHVLASLRWWSIEILTRKGLLVAIVKVVLVSKCVPYAGHQ